jgi:hypothetical protein
MQPGATRAVLPSPPSIAGAVIALQRSVGNRAVAAMVQRVNFERGVRANIRSADAATAKRWVEELEAGDWKQASISHVNKLALHLAHLARKEERDHGEDAAKALWQYKRRAEQVQRLVEIRESNTLGEKYSYTEVSKVMELHAAVAGPRPDKDD